MKVISRYVCPRGCCDVVVTKLSHKTLRISRNGEVIVGYTALGRAIGLSPDGAKTRIVEKRCLQVPKSDAYLAENQAQKPPVSNVDPLVRDFLIRMAGTAGPRVD